MEDEEELLKPFDYINSDINLLALHILLEGFYRGQNVFTLDQFIKGDYWKIDAITEEIRDTQDYGSAEDLVLHQIIQIVRDLGLGKVKRISLTTIYGLTETVVENAIKEKQVTEENVLFYSGVIDEIANLRKLKDKQIEEKINLGVEWRKELNRVDFTENNFSKHFQYITEISAPFIEFEIDFNKEKAQELNEEIDDFAFNFYQDDYVEEKPLYLEKRHYFSKQIENFYEYIKKFPIVDGYVNIPFSSLSEKGFEIIKIMAYLEKEKRVKVRNWNDKDLWNVKFHQTPITMSSLLGLVDKVEEKQNKKEEIKLNLSFSPQIATMILKSNKDKEYKIKVQGQVQKEVIRVIFQNPKNTYSDWSLYDIAELLGGNEVDEVAVKNAIYQFNRKVKLSIPEVENIFELTKHSAKLNLKYVDKN
ncbi:MAG: hypothetical protein V1851_00400 [Patescibacteria group bacterium]